MRISLNRFDFGPIIVYSSLLLIFARRSPNDKFAIAHMCNPRQKPREINYTVKCAERLVTKYFHGVASDWMIVMRAFAKLNHFFLSLNWLLRHWLPHIDRSVYICGRGQCHKKVLFRRRLVDVWKSIHQTEIIMRVRSGDMKDFTLTSSHTHTYVPPAISATKKRAETCWNNVD